MLYIFKTGFSQQKFMKSRLYKGHTDGQTGKANYIGASIKK